MSGLSDIPSGPFLASPTKRDGKKVMGLLWIGVPEQCDRCKELWPMSWVTYDGTHYLCQSCHWDIHVKHKNFDITISDDLNLIEVCPSCYKYFTVDKMTISYNELICRQCARKRYEKTMVENYKREQVRREAERVKPLTEEQRQTMTPEQKEAADREAMKAYYDRMCC